MSTSDSARVSDVPVQPLVRKVKPVAGPPPNPPRNYHKLRKIIHVVCVAIFIALPFFDLLRFDIPRQRFYFAGQELWISEFGIIFLTLMFLMFLVVGSAMLFGRVYCSYLCPQMIFSEASMSIETWLRKRVQKKYPTMKPPQREKAVRWLFLALLLPVSVFLAFVFIAYFVPPMDLLHRLMRFDIRTAGGIAGATTTLLTFLDFAFLRLRFCTTVCPYGYLQGFLSDHETLIVHYRDQKAECIECKKCVRVCPMLIDIRESPYQIECVHCGECIDACDQIMGRLGKDGLIHYAWGERGNIMGKEQTTWWRKLGLRDARRFVVAAVILVYAIGLTLALSLRKPVLVQLLPDRATLYQVAPDGSVHNHFRLRIANRGKSDANLALRVDSLPGARLQGLPEILPLKAGDSLQKDFDIVVDSPASLSEMVTHFQVRVGIPGEKDMEFPLTFIAPTEKSGKKS